MDNIILSDKILNQQICTECKNYLSVGPVLVTGNGRIICGRCSKDVHPGIRVLEHSLYNLVAEKLVFKCINYYTGCEELLHFNEALEHEKTCKELKLVCPFCDYEGNGCQLVHHFHEKHRKYVVKEGFFNVNIENQFSRNLVFIKSNNIFCLTVSMADNLVRISNSLLTPGNLGPKQFKLRFFQSESNVEFVTCPIQVVHNNVNILRSESIESNASSQQFNKSFSLDQTSLLEYFSSGSCLCKLDFNETDEEAEKILNMNYSRKIENATKLPPPKEVKATFFSIASVLTMSPTALRDFINTKLYLLQTCVNCKQYTLSVFLCPKYHVACGRCTRLRCFMCQSCWWSRRSDVHDISLTCEWDGCRKRTDIFHYLNHKQQCFLRKYQCPDARCEFAGRLEDLKNHWHLKPLICDTLLSFRHRDSAIFWLSPACREIFYLTVEYHPVFKETLVTIHGMNGILSRLYDFTVLGWRKINAFGLEFGMWPDSCKSIVYSPEYNSSVKYLKLRVPKTRGSGAYITCFPASMGLR